MKPEKLVEELEQAWGEKLRSVILYGSAAAGDYVGKHSDLNVLVVAKSLDQATLKSFAKTARKWSKDGNPPPLLFTEERLRQAADVFPIELLDIKECRKILYGSDPIENIEIDTSNLRLEIEHELRGKLIQLRQRYLTVADKRRRTAELMVESVGTFLVLLRAALRLFEKNVPVRKVEALDHLDRHIECDLSVFKTVNSLKAGQAKTGDIAVDQLFDQYLAAIESVVDEVDRCLESDKRGD